MDSLKFIETMSVADFKTKMEVERIDVKQNPHTGKCFFVYGCETGAVSEKIPQRRHHKACHLTSLFS